MRRLLEIGRHRRAGGADRRALCARALPAASGADRSGQLHRQPLGEPERPPVPRRLCTCSLYRRDPDIDFLRRLIILVLYGAAIASKEHTAMLPPLLLLTDYFWNPRLLVRGYHAKLAALCAVRRSCAGWGSSSLRHSSRLLRRRSRASRTSRWYQYFLTQFRVHLRITCVLFLLPVDQSAPTTTSRSRALAGARRDLLGIALLSLCRRWRSVYRKRAPLAVLRVPPLPDPAGSDELFLPIKDPLAERRLYLPFIGLVLITSDASCGCDGAAKQVQR